MVWTNLAGEELRAVSLAFDGLPVQLDAQGRGSLPAHDLRAIHVLTAQVDFKPDDARCAGTSSTAASTAARWRPSSPACPSMSAPARLPPAAKLGGWLLADGKPLAVDAVEEGPGKLFVVCAAPTNELGGKMAADGRLIGDIHYEMRLGSEDQIHFVPAVPERISRARRALGPVPDHARRAATTVGGLLWLLRRIGTAPWCRTSRGSPTRWPPPASRR